MKFFLNLEDIDTEKYILATYQVESSKSLHDAAWNIAIGQSVGNPNVRNRWETEDLFQTHSCLIIGNEEELKAVKSGLVTIAFPTINTNWEEEAVSHLLCQLIGGQTDIDSILKCRLVDLEFSKEIEKKFQNPQYGIPKIREFTNVHNKPLLGGIIKPKTGISPQTLLNMVEELVEGGVNFIKEDEILSSPSFCSIEERVPLIMKYLKGKPVIYAVCINADAPHVLERAKRVYELGGNAVHVNIWCGLSTYHSIRKLNLPLFIHFQKSGDKVITDPRNPYGIDWNVICKLAGMMGVDFIHAGMWGGYKSDEAEELKRTLDTLHKYKVMPALSCGMHPGLVNAISEKFGTDYMANVGGAIHGHPMGTLSGAKAMRQAIDGTFGEEYDAAIKTWGEIKC